MNLKYSPIQRLAKKVYRKFMPIQKSSYTIGHIDDICAVNLVPPENLKSFFTNCIKILRKIKGEDIGDYLEFGVFNGSSMASMYLSSKAAGSNSRFFGFDAFEGLPAGSENEDDGVWKKGFYACSFEKMQECLRKKNVDPDQIHWVKGWYDQILTPETAKTHRIENIGIAFIDCDTYSSSKAVLDFLKPLLTGPAILCFDDWKLNDLDLKGMGEYKSFNEFLGNNPQFTVQEIKSYNRKSRSFLIQPRSFQDRRVRS